MQMYFLCGCEHPRGNHSGNFKGGRSYCNKCDCNKYKSDNLSYLEKRYEESLKNDPKYSG